jgi:hypothetical protein
MMNLTVKLAKDIHRVRSVLRQRRRQPAHKDRTNVCTMCECRTIESHRDRGFLIVILFSFF